MLTATIEINSPNVCEAKRERNPAVELFQTPRPRASLLEDHGPVYPRDGGSLQAIFSWANLALVLRLRRIAIRMVAPMPSPEKHPVGKARSIFYQAAEQFTESWEPAIRAFVVIPAKRPRVALSSGSSRPKAGGSHFKGFWILALHGASRRPTDQVRGQAHNDRPDP